MQEDGGAGVAQPALPEAGRVGPDRFAAAPPAGVARERWDATVTGELGTRAPRAPCRPGRARSPYGRAVLRQRALTLGQRLKIHKKGITDRCGTTAIALPFRAFLSSPPSAFVFCSVAQRGRGGAGTHSHSLGEQWGGRSGRRGVPRSPESAAPAAKRGCLAPRPARPAVRRLEAARRTAARGRCCPRSRLHCAGAWGLATRSAGTSCPNRGPSAEGGTVPRTVCRAETQGHEEDTGGVHQERNTVKPK